MVEYVFRGLTGDDVDGAYELLISVTEWLESKAIHQWSRRFPKSTYRGWVESGICFGLFEGISLLGVFTLTKSDLSEYFPEPKMHVNWLRTMAVSREHAHAGHGRRIIDWVLTNTDGPVYLDCSTHDGILPDFYGQNRFLEVMTKHLYGDDMMLMVAGLE